MQASLVANCVFNTFLPFTAITLNIVTILALRKPLTIPGALKVLLLSLAVSDLGVGLPVQPLENDKSCHADKRKHSNSNF